METSADTAQLSTTDDVAAAAALLADAAEVTLLGHVSPDADAVGSALGLGLALHRRGVRVRVSFPEPPPLPSSLRALDTDGLIVSPGELPEHDDILVVLDCAEAGRLASLAGRVANARAVLVVDHHASHLPFGTQRVVDTAAEATAVLVLRILDALEVRLDPEIAACLYAGLVTDTGSFRRARPSTHHTAARLIAAGADPDALGRALLQSRPFAWLPMLARVLSGARLDRSAAHGLGLVHAAVTLDDAAEVRTEDVEAIVDVVRSVSEAEVVAVFKEVPSGVDSRRWTVSLRARSKVDVSAAARTLGGGGHRLAAGCTVEGDPDAIVAAVCAALAEAPLR